MTGRCLCLAAGCILPDIGRGRLVPRAGGSEGSDITGRQEPSPMAAPASSLYKQVLFRRWYCDTAGRYGAVAGGSAVVHVAICPTNVPIQGRLAVSNTMSSCDKSQTWSELFPLETVLYLRHLGNDSEPGATSLYLSSFTILKGTYPLVRIP